MDLKIDLTGVYLETERLYLRAWDSSDLEDFYDYAKDPDVGPRAGWEAHASIGVTKRILDLFIEHKKTFALELKETGRVIGSVGIETIGPKEAEASLVGYLGKEIGYVLKKDYWNQGIMTEAVTAVIDYCFRELGLDYLFCGHFKDNAASKRIIEKMGFRFFKSFVFEDQRGIPQNTLLYYLWNPEKKRPVDL